MKVIDIGCGNGEVTFLVADLVGSSGTVLGIDRNEKAIADAIARAKDMGYSNVAFVRGDLSDPVSRIEESDVVVGRRVLMYLADPVSVIRRISGFLRPGGLCVFQESDSTMVPGKLAAMPLHDQVMNWIRKTVEREGADIRMGFHLPSVLRHAGIVVDHVRAEPVIQGEDTHYPLAFIVSSMLPRIVAHGVATESEIEVQTLEKRLNAERPADTVYISDMAFGIWGHKPLSDDTSA
jgi:SAM-dependent methyltransferase